MPEIGYLAQSAHKTQQEHSDRDWQENVAEMMVGWLEFAYGFRLQGRMLVESFSFAGRTNGQKDEDAAGHCKCLRGDFVQKTDHVTEDRRAELE